MLDDPDGLLEDDGLWEEEERDALLEEGLLEDPLLEDRSMVMNGMIFGFACWSFEVDV